MTPSRRVLLKHVGGAISLSFAGCLNSSQTGLPGVLRQEWISNTAIEYDGNHHAIALATVDGQQAIAIPRNDVTGSEKCGVVAIDTDGNERWQNTIPPEHCNAHAIGDVGVGDFTGDDTPEFLAATDTQDVYAYDAASGEETFRQALLESIGYSAPVVADLTGDGTPELAVADFVGNLSVVRPDGSIVWTYELDQPVYVTPIVADFTGDETPELVANHGRLPAEVICLDGDGEVVWRTEQEYASLTWSLVEQDAGPALVTTSGESVALLDGASGEQQWTRTLEERVAVGDAGAATVYATATGGTVRAVALGDGADRWTEQITDEDVRMSAPALGSVTGDGTPHVVATAHDGTVAVLDAESGNILARRQLDTSLYTQPVIADVTGTEVDEILVLYGDGRVAALSYEETN